tara:strand:- start:1092 stop:1436 length:345 start_codon:yes stop_codon:yes gene_type:complete
MNTLECFKVLKQPHSKHTVERIVEDVVRSAYSGLSQEEQTNAYNELMYSLFDTLRERMTKGNQPFRISEGNSFWKNYRNRYLPNDETFHTNFETACKEMIELYSGNIPGNFGKE